MSQMSFERPKVDGAFAALRADLIHDDGPRISTMRNYRFAILQYDPREEFALRAHAHRLVADLQSHGWVTLTVSLHRLMLDRLRALGDDQLARIAAMERSLADRGHPRALNYLAGKVVRLLEGPEGIAADCARIVTDFVEAHPDQADRTLVLVGRAGALYPFLRTSALLKHLDGRTRNVPVVLLYPGERKHEAGLSFMGVLDPDRDYRPRIYS